jgi:hypothetical protein
VEVTVNYPGPIPDGSKLVFAANLRFPPTGPPQATTTLETFTFPAKATLRGLEPRSYAIFVGLDVPPSYAQTGGRPGKEDVNVLSSAPIEVPPGETVKIELTLPMADAGAPDARPD